MRETSALAGPRCPRGEPERIAMALFAGRARRFSETWHAGALSDEVPRCVRPHRRLSCRLQ
jgi:hypothetical protein